MWITSVQQAAQNEQRRRRHAAKIALRSEHRNQQTPAAHWPAASGPESCASGVRAMIKPATVAISTVHDVVVSIVDTGNDVARRAAPRPTTSAMPSHRRMPPARPVPSTVRLDSCGYGRRVGTRPTIEGRRECAGRKQHQHPQRIAERVGKQHGRQRAFRQADRPASPQPDWRSRRSRSRSARRASSSRPAASTSRNSTYTSTIAIRMLAIAHANTASTRGPTARIARRSQVTISRNSSAGSSCAVSVRCAVCTSGVGDQTPADRERRDEQISPARSAAAP